MVHALATASFLADSAVMKLPPDPQTRLTVLLAGIATGLALLVLYNLAFRFLS